MSLKRRLSPFAPADKILNKMVDMLFTSIPVTPLIAEFYLASIRSPHLSQAFGFIKFSLTNNLLGSILVELRIKN
jgi:hypothetical protein